MAYKEFILQGFTSRTHADAVRELFDIDQIERVLLSVAFVSESGVQLLEGKIRPHAAKTTVFAGIRNDITSHQGLAALFSLASDLFVVDTGSRQVLFHPKMYLVRSSEKARLLIGSANLTLGGLNNNIEAGMLLGFDMQNAVEKAVVATIEAELDKLPGDYPKNVLRIGTMTEINALLAEGRVLDETVVPSPRPGPSPSTTGNKDTTPRIRLNVPPIHRASQSSGTAARPKPAKAPGSDVAAVPAPKAGRMAAGIQYDCVWKSRPLSLRDINMPDGKNTHKTYSMSLDKGLLPAEVDHRHYFREEIFDQLTWSVTSRKTTEEAIGTFHLVIKGMSYGEFDLKISHTMGTTSKAYRQKNAMTRLRWGPTEAYLSNPDLKDRTLSLYKDLADPTRFMLEID